jgi:hypothetical protein
VLEKERRKEEEGMRTTIVPPLHFDGKVMMTYSRFTST